MTAGSRKSTSRGRGGVALSADFGDGSFTGAADNLEELQTKYVATDVLRGH